MSRRRLAIYGAAIAVLGYLLYRALPRAEPVDSSAGERAAAEGASSAKPSELRARVAPRVVRESAAEASSPAAGEAAGEGRVEGLVREVPGRKPIRGATLVFSGRAGRRGVRTDPSGHYGVELAAGRYRVAIIADGHRERRDIELRVEGGARATGVDFSLEALAKVAGQVVDRRGRTVAGAKVSVVSSSERDRLALARGSSGSGARSPGQPFATRSDSAGRFALELASGKVVLQAVARARGRGTSRPLFLRPGQSVRGVELTVGGGLSLSGQVIASGGRRVARARVVMRDRRGQREIPCDADGRFTVGGLAPGKKQLQATAPGYSPSRVSEVEVQSAGEARAVLRLAARHALRGRVIDGRGEPVGEARVEARPGNGARAMVSLVPPVVGKSAADGSFTLGGVVDLPQIVEARGPRGGRALRTGVSPDVRQLELRLDGPGGIVGKVTDGASADPIRSFTIRLSREGWSLRLRVASAAGAYAIGELAPGNYTVRIGARGYGAQVVQDVHVVEGGNARADGVLYAGGRIAGVVVDRRGAGVPGAAVRMETGWLGRPVLSDNQGRFTLRDVAKGRRSLTVSHPDYDTRIVGGVSVFPRKTTETRVELHTSHGRRGGLRLSGVGLVMRKHADKLLVVRPLPRGPAALAGLRAGDVIAAIDGHSTAAMTFDKAVEAIRGIVGTPVRLRIVRGHGRPFAVDIIRAEVEVDEQG